MVFVSKSIGTERRLGTYWVRIRNVEVYAILGAATDELRRFFL